MKVCVHHDDLRKDITRVETKVDFLVEREHDKQRNWERKRERKRTLWTWIVTSLIALMGVAIGLYELVVKNKILL